MERSAGASASSNSDHNGGSSREFAASHGSVPCDITQLCSSDTSLLQKRRLSSFTNDEKLAMLAEWRVNGWNLTTAAKEMCVPRGTLSGWRKEYSDKSLITMNVPVENSGRERAKGAGRKVKAKEYERKALEYVDQCAIDGEAVTPASILEHCTRDSEFAALNPKTQRTRIRRFINRHSITSSLTGSNDINGDATIEAADDNAGLPVGGDSVQDADLPINSASASADAEQLAADPLGSASQVATSTSTSTSTSANESDVGPTSSASSSSSSSSTSSRTVSTTTTTTTSGSGSASASAATGSKSRASSQSKSSYPA